MTVSIEKSSANKSYLTISYRIELNYKRLIIANT